MRAYATYLAIHENLNVGDFVATMECESGFNQNAIGDHGESFGAVQLHLPAHPDITKEQALNGIWSLNWAADEWVAGRQNIWTCYHKVRNSHLADE